MVNLNRKDIEDIAKGYHNTHVQNCDPQELLKKLAQQNIEMYDKRKENISDFQEQLDDLKNMINEYMAKLDDEDLVDIDDKIEEIADSLEELKYV